MASEPVEVSVIADEKIAECPPFNNGAGPLWAFGSRVIARAGQDIWASAPEVDPEARPLCNIRYKVMRRDAAGHWRQVHRADRATEREPCPLIRLPGERVVLSTQPSVGVRSTRPDGPEEHHCQPTLLVFAADQPEAPPQAVLPQWDQTYQFTEHSYRALAADPDTGSVFLTDQLHFYEGYPHCWTFMDADLKPIAGGQLWFPMRGCYQQAAVRGNAVYVMAISDEIEPMSAWREFKRQVTGKEWDYEFRQLFFTWTPDITTTPFSPPLTVASHDETAGFIRNMDLWLDEHGDAWLLYYERNSYHAFLRDKFFPNMPLRTALRVARIHRGRVIERHTLLEAHEDRSATVAGGQNLDGITFDAPYTDWAAWHGCPDGRLFALWHQLDGGGGESGNYLRQVLPELGPARQIPLAAPLQAFQPACPRNGCPPSNEVDLYGLSDAGQVIRYVQLSI